MNDVTLSTKRWEAIYKRDKLKKDFDLDLTIISYKKFLDKYKKDLKKGNFLDLGCGVAFLSALLAREGISITGIDVSKNAIEKSKKIFKEEKLKGNFIQGDLLNLPFKDKTFSFIYSCRSGEHTSELQSQ